MNRLGGGGERGMQETFRWCDWLELYLKVKKEPKSHVKRPQAPDSVVWEPLVMSALGHRHQQTHLLIQDKDCRPHFCVSSPWTGGTPRGSQSYLRNDLFLHSRQNKQTPRLPQINNTNDWETTENLLTGQEHTKQRSWPSPTPSLSRWGNQGPADQGTHCLSLLPSKSVPTS